MFTNINRNKEMLLGAYKKLKSYYHYNKNFIFMKQKIAEFEYDSEKMSQSLEEIARIMTSPDAINNKELVQNWLNQISFFAMPKAFVESKEKNELFITESIKENKAVKRVNFFIDMPIQLFLLDTLWTVLLGKLIYEKQVIAPESYGNSIDNFVLYNGQRDFFESINFQKNKLFKIYYPQYRNWKNNAIETIEKENKNKKSQIMFSLDIKSFYYSVLWKFDFLESIFENDKRFEALKTLTLIIEEIFVRYTTIIEQYRDIPQNKDNKEVLLPIGLFSSMVLANIYLAKFDRELKHKSGVLFYGRYVDDIIIILDVTGDEENVNDKTAFDRYLVNKNTFLDKVDGETYNLHGFPTLYIQKNKVKMIYFNCGKSKSLISQLKKTITYPSQMNVIPKTEIDLVDFEEAVYAKSNIGSDTKIRDIGQMEINRFQLGWHMSQIVLNSRFIRDNLTKEEKIQRQKESESILDFFVGSKALEYSSNWINAMYYFLLTSDMNRNAWKKFEHNIREAIEKITISQMEDIKKWKAREIKTRLKRHLNLHFDICIATALALNLKFSKKEKKDIKLLAKKVRAANMFNHYLVSFPLVNYVDDLNDECDLTKISVEDIGKMHIRDSRKVRLSPRFVNVDEIFQFVFLNQCTKGGSYYLDSATLSVHSKLLYIEEFFYAINHINKESAGHLAISIENEDINGYILQNIQLGTRKKKKEKVRIAIANIKLDIKRCCLGLERLENVILNRLDLIDFMDKAYSNGKNKVDYIVFPEFYMPLQWITDVLSFVRKSGITVISGLQYISNGRRAYNNVALFSPIKTGQYKNAIMLVREKNDYAPMEQELLAIENYMCVNQKKPIYQIINHDGIKYGIFLCYEFTDIVARSLYKNKVDILFTPEHNKDTSYFSSIIESTARDLHVFIVQSNTSIYGDSRITGPYGKNDRNVIQIKGGDEDDIIVGTIELEKLKKYQKAEKRDFEKKIKKYLSLASPEKHDKEQELFKKHELKIAKTSARFYEK